MSTTPEILCADGRLPQGPARAAPDPGFGVRHWIDVHAAVHDDVCVRAVICHRRLGARTWELPVTRRLRPPRSVPGDEADASDLARSIDEPDELLGRRIVCQ